MDITARLVSQKSGRNPGMAGQAVLKGLISALNNQMGVFSATGHMPNARSYNQNVAYDLADDGLVPQGQAAPFIPQVPRKPWTR